jgi:hypothetical protein
MPSWTSQDSSRESNSLTLGDVNNDGFIDVIVSDNNQLGGTGYFKLYLNNAGALSSTPDWVSAEHGLGSGVALADIDGNGYLDLTTGMWGEDDQIGNGHLRVHMNDAGVLSQEAEWVSTTNSVVEAIFFADLNRDGTIETTFLQTLAEGHSVVYLSHTPLDDIYTVTLNGELLEEKDFCFQRELGWLSLNRELVTPQSELMVLYIYSEKLDLIASNWDSDVGNFIFFHKDNPLD